VGLWEREELELELEFLWNMDLVGEGSLVSEELDLVVGSFQAVKLL